MTDLILASDVLTAISVVMQAIDTHTTSEILKRRIGVEANDNLAPFLNTEEEHRFRFWRLVGIKAACALLLLSICAVAHYLEHAGMQGHLILVIAVQSVLAGYYAMVMGNNWRIYRQG